MDTKETLREELVRKNEQHVLRFCEALLYDDFKAEFDDNLRDDWQGEHSHLQVVVSAVCFFMTKKKRDGGDWFWCWRDDTPSVLRDEFCELLALDDWRYEKLIQIAEGHERGWCAPYVDPDVYYSDLVKWLAAQPVKRAGMVEDSWAHLGGDLFQAMQTAQTMEIGAMTEAFIHHAETLTDKLFGPHAQNPSCA